LPSSLSHRHCLVAVKCQLPYHFTLPTSPSRSDAVSGDSAAQRRESCYHGIVVSRCDGATAAEHRRVCSPARHHDVWNVVVLSLAAIRGEVRSQRCPLRGCRKSSVGTRRRPRHAVVLRSPVTPLRSDKCVGLSPLSVIHKPLPKLLGGTGDVFGVTREVWACAEVYQAQHPQLVLATFALVYIVLQTFAIPGPIVLSILSGAMYPRFVSVRRVTVLQGRVCAAFFLMLVARPHHGCRRTAWVHLLPAFKRRLWWRCVQQRVPRCVTSSRSTSARICWNCCCRTSFPCSDRRCVCMRVCLCVCVCVCLCVSVCV
jgi:hypothetical protein